MSPATGRSDGRASTDRRTEVLRQLHGCLGETAEALSSGGGSAVGGSDRVRAAVERLEDARRALVPLLRERGAAGPGPASAVPPVRRCLELPADDSASREARAFCRSVLTEWSLARPVAEAAVDVASELMTNAARHATAVVRLGLELVSDGLVVSVWDDGPGRPHVLPHRPGPSDRGIGLHWVEALTTSWGWTEERGGKRVWAVVPVAR